MCPRKVPKMCRTDVDFFYWNILYSAEVRLHFCKRIFVWKGRSAQEREHSFNLQLYTYRSRNFHSFSFESAKWNVNYLVNFAFLFLLNLKNIDKRKEIYKIMWKARGNVCKSLRKQGRSREIVNGESTTRKRGERMGNAWGGGGG